MKDMRQHNGNARNAAVDHLVRNEKNLKRYGHHTGPYDHHDRALSQSRHLDCPRFPGLVGFFLD
ncbi:hypothetical protein D3C71_1655900 [compost metagenome]